MGQTDWIILSITFLTSLFASIITGLIISKRKKEPNATNSMKHQQPKNITFKASDTNTKHIPFQKQTPKCTLPSISQPISTIPSAPILPPTSVNKMYLMDGKWKQHNQNRHYIINASQFDFKQIQKPNHTTRQLLTQLIPSLNKDMIQIISSFLSEINLCISKYALLDCANQYIQFFMNDLDFSAYTKTIIIPINTYTSFTQQMLHKINQNYISNISNNTQPQIECSIYFHDNHNAIIEGQYFILSLFCDSVSEIDISCNILCQFGDHCINIIQQIYLHWTHSLWSSKLSTFAKLPLLDIKFDGKYIYAAKDNMFSVNLFNSKSNVLQSVILKHPPNKHTITYYNICDFYLIVSRQNYDKLELYKIDSNNIRYLYHEFELQHIFATMNKEYNDRFDKKGGLQKNLYPNNDTILGFEISDHDILFCVYYNIALNRLFVANIKLSIFEEPKLITYNLLDGKIGNIVPSLHLRTIYRKCIGIEVIHTNKGKDWLVFCEMQTPFNVFYETEFRINANSLVVKYGKRKTKAANYRYLKSDNRKQMSFSSFM